MVDLSSFRASLRLKAAGPLPLTSSIACKPFCVLRNEAGELPSRFGMLTVPLLKNRWTRVRASLRKIHMPRTKPTFEPAFIATREF